MINASSKTVLYRRFRCCNIESIFGHHGNSRWERVEVTFAFVRGTKPTRSSCICFSGKNLTHNSGNGNKRRFIAIVLVVVVAVAVVPSTFSLAKENICQESSEIIKLLFLQRRLQRAPCMVEYKLKSIQRVAIRKRWMKKKRGKNFRRTLSKVGDTRAYAKRIYIYIYSYRKVFMNFLKRPLGF